MYQKHSARRTHRSKSHYTKVKSGLTFVRDGFSAKMAIETRLCEKAMQSGNEPLIHDVYSAEFSKNGFQIGGAQPQGLEVDTFISHSRNEFL